MAKLTIKTDGVTPREIELQPGINKIGRAFSNDFQIHAPSISGHHCEITLQNETILVKDLGSTNGTFIDQQRIKEKQLEAGQILRLGDVEFLQESAPVVKPAFCVTMAQPEPVLVPKPNQENNLPVPPPFPPPPPRRVARLIPLGKSKRPTNFYQNILGAFQYPFKRDGIILLVTGTIFFGGAGLFLIHGYGFGFAAAGFLGAFVSGYLFTYQQDIISTSVMGDEEMPSWPDFINVWDSGIRAWLELVGILLFCFGPAWACLVFAPGSWKWCSLPLALAGAIYWPMGLLAVTLSGSLIALNPLTVVLSILRVPLEYLVLCLTLGLLLTLNIGLSILLTEYVDYPMVTALVEGFFSLYFMTVQMRLLGLLYYCKREALDWGF